MDEGVSKEVNAIRLNGYEGDGEMSRKRYISTDISTDPKLAELAEHGMLPLLLFTWSIPHMDDWGRMTGDPRQFKLMVCPGLDITSKDVEQALKQIEQVGLWMLYEVDNKKYISAHPSSWFKHQSYINKDKRNNDEGSIFPPPPNGGKPFNDEGFEDLNDNADVTEMEESPHNAEEHRGTPQNPVSFSSSPSFTNNKKHSSYSDEFEQFWSIYPRKEGKKRAYSCWQARLKSESPLNLIRAATNYAKKCALEKTETRYIKHPSTFLSAKQDYEDYLESNIIPFDQSEAIRQRKLAESRKLLEEYEKRAEEARAAPPPDFEEIRRKIRGHRTS